MSGAHSIHSPGPSQAHSIPPHFGLPALYQASAHPPLGTTSHAVLPEGPSPTQPHPNPLREELSVSVSVGVSECAVCAQHMSESICV